MSILFHAFQAVYGPKLDQKQKRGLALANSLSYFYVRLCYFRLVIYMLEFIWNNV